MADSREPSAAQGSPESRTVRTASAVEVAGTSSAPARLSRRKRPHCAVAWGWDSTRVTSASSSGAAAIRLWWIGWTTSAEIRTPSASPASASSVAATPPSSEFSIGTTARSVSPSWTAMTVSWTVEHGTASTSPGRRCEQGLLRVGPGGPQERDGEHQPASAVSSASRSSGESSSSDSPSTIRLTYTRAFSRWRIEDITRPERWESSSAIELDWRPDISL